MNVECILSILFLLPAFDEEFGSYRIFAYTASSVSFSAFFTQDRKEQSVFLMCRFGESLFHRPYVRKKCRIFGCSKV